MRIITYIILIVFFSCKEFKKNKTTSVLSNHLALKENEQSIPKNDFIKRIKELPTAKFPFDFINCDVNALSELETSGPLETILNIEIDSLIPVKKENDSLFYPLSIKKINNSTSLFFPKYYAFLLEHKEEDTALSFSNSYVYKRLKPLNQIEIILLITKIYDVKMDETRVIGTQLDILTYNAEQKKSIDRERLITIGIGLEDIAYYECFNINSHYEIHTKSFMNLEDESTSIRRKLTINPKGEIELSNPEVIVSD